MHQDNIKPPAEPPPAPATINNMHSDSTSDTINQNDKEDNWAQDIMDHILDADDI